ncbi:unnamed protein product [Polarella glacialis]|uniref:Ubiquitin fusion degradation protein UFD1 N-terminal subdomain 1 domain-containing protein n=1 Tax=Polarella glacialis TaxID=89957 RepID=A0A813GTQ5_POLGL|nr:unnamed protein product [Polarella glacialis]
MGGDGGPGGFFGGTPGRFDHQYQVFPVSFMGREDLERGNKIILPQSALDHLARLNISYPMLFEAGSLGVTSVSCTWLLIFHLLGWLLASLLAVLNIHLLIVVRLSFYNLTVRCSRRHQLCAFS